MTIYNKNMRQGFYSLPQFYHSSNFNALSVKVQINIIGIAHRHSGIANMAINPMARQNTTPLKTFFSLFIQVFFLPLTMA